MAHFFFPLISRFLYYFLHHANKFQSLPIRTGGVSVLSATLRYPMYVKRNTAAFRPIIAIKTQKLFPFRHTLANTLRCFAARSPQMLSGRWRNPPFALRLSAYVFLFCRTHTFALDYCLSLSFMLHVSSNRITQIRRYFVAPTHAFHGVRRAQLGSIEQALCTLNVWYEHVRIERYIYRTILGNWQTLTVTIAGFLVYTSAGALCPISQAVIVRGDLVLKCA